MSKKFVNPIPQELLMPPVAYNAMYARITGSVTAALFLSQAIYWSTITEDPEGWFYRTAKQWENDLGMGRAEQEAARKRLRSMGILYDERRGQPAQLFYRIDIEKLVGYLTGAEVELTVDQMVEIFGHTMRAQAKTAYMRSRRKDVLKDGAVSESVSYEDVLREKGPVCGICGEKILYGPGNEDRQLAFDYVIPLHDGGSHAFDNISPAHAGCSVLKGEGKAPAIKNDSGKQSGPEGSSQKQSGSHVQTQTGDSLATQTEPHMQRQTETHMQRQTETPLQKQSLTQESKRELQRLKRETPPDGGGTPSPTRTEGNRPVPEHGRSASGDEPSAPHPVAPDGAVPVSVQGKQPVYKSAKDRSYALASQYLKAQGLTQKDVSSRAWHASAAVLADLPDRYGEEDVIGCVRYLLTDAWYREPGRLTPAQVAKTIPQWVAQGRPEARVPSGAQHGRKPSGDDWRHVARQLREQR